MAKEKLMRGRKICPGRETKESGRSRKVRRYRYRTPALTGPWRESHDDAVRDAVKAKQAEYDEGQPPGLKWIVPGEIEARRNETAAEPAKR